MPTSTVSAIDLINFSQSIAQLNLGYLGISVAILGVLGGVFVYFNFKPLKDDLNKQEDKINNLKTKADNLLNEVETQTGKTLDEFKKSQSVILSESLTQQRETIDLQTVNKIQAVENSVLERIDAVSGEKDSALKEVLLSEMSNKILSLEKTFVAALEEYKKTNNETVTSLKNKTEATLKRVDSDIIDLQAYKYDMEGKMGGIILTIEALEKCIENEPHLLQFKLKDLEEKIGKYDLSPELFIRLKAVLKKAEGLNNGDEHSEVINKIREKVTLEDKPEI